MDELRIEHLKQGRELPKGVPCLVYAPFHFPADWGIAELGEDGLCHCPNSDEPVPVKRIHAFIPLEQ